MEPSDPARAREALAKAQAFSQEGLQDIRRSLAALRTSPLDNKSLADALRAIREHAAAIRELVAPGQPFGLGLRIANAASLELESPACLQELQATLTNGHFYVFTINGFPYGAFHDAAVKADVYRPDWRDSVRRAYTCRVTLPRRTSTPCAHVPFSSTRVAVALVNMVRLGRFFAGRR